MKADSLTPITRTSPLARTALAGTGLAVAAALGLTGCAAADSGSDDALQVVATTTQLADFARQIGGDDADVTGLLPPGGSAHHFDPSPDDLLKLGEADVLIVNGAGLETFIDSAIESSGFDGTIITAADGIDQEEAKHITAEGEAEAGHEHGDEHEHEHEEGEEHHHHGPVNPHLWTSPRYAADMAAEVTKGLAAADADAADAIQERGDAYVAQLHELDAWVGDQMAEVPEADRVLVTGHDSMRYYLHDYDIAFGGAILPSFEDNAEPSAAEIDELVAHIKADGIKAIFVESSMSPKLAETVGKESGAQVIDSDKLYTDSLGASDSDGATYIDATIHNTQTILEAWGVTPAEAPADLAD